MLGEAGRLDPLSAPKGFHCSKLCPDSGIYGGREFLAVTLVSCCSRLERHRLRIVAKLPRSAIEPSVDDTHTGMPSDCRKKGFVRMCT